MQRITPLIFSIIAAVLLGSCNSSANKKDCQLTEAEQKICDSMKVEASLLCDIRRKSSGEVEPFHYSLSKTYKDGQMTEVDPIKLNGLIIKEQNYKSYDVVFLLKDEFRKKGYTIFVVENNFDIDKKPDHIALLKTTDQFSILKQIGTKAINYHIDNDSLITLMKQFNSKYSLELIGASGDWCEFVIHKEQANWLDFAKEVYAVCPDVVEQGAGNVKALAEELRRTKRLYFWWD